MKYLALLLLLPIPCYGQIVVSDDLPPPVKYPAEVYKMTDAEFQAWAEDRNKVQQAAVEERRKLLTEEKWIQGTESVSDGSHFDFGYGGYDYGCNSWAPWYGGWYGGCYNGNFGGWSQRTTEYPVRWQNPAYVGPRPVVIVNPYCRPTP